PQPLAGPSLPFPGGERRLTAPDRRRRPRPGRPPPPDRRASSAPGRPGRPGPRKGETVELAEGEQAALRLGQPAEHVADRDRVAREFRHSELLRVRQRELPAAAPYVIDEDVARNAEQPGGR